MKKLLVFALSVVFIVSSIGLVSAKTKINVWISNTFYQRYIDVFNQLHPDVEATLVFKPGIENILMTAIAGGEPPDVARISRQWVASFAARGGLECIDDYIKRDKIDLSIYFPGAIGECKYRGKMYAMPFNTDVHPLYYNRTMFKENGLNPDKPPKTWKELEEYAKKLTKIEGGKPVTMGFIPTFGNVHFVCYYWQTGGDLFTPDRMKVAFNNDKALMTLQWIVDFVNNICGGAKIVDGFKAAMANPTTGADMWAFMNNKLAMMIGVCTPIVTFQQYAPNLDYDIVLPPIPPGGKQVTLMEGFGFVIPKGVKNKDAAWEFLKWMSSPATQVRFSQLGEPPLGGGGMTIVKDVALNAPFFKEQPMWAKAVNMVRYGKFFPTTPVTGFAKDTITKMVDKAIAGEMTPKQALEWAANEVQKELDKFYQASK
jgi:multiple sugar transport system substrate-binding protein